MKQVSNVSIGEENSLKRWVFSGFERMEISRTVDVRREVSPVQ